MASSIEAILAYQQAQAEPDRAQEISRLRDVIKRAKEDGVIDESLPPTRVATAREERDRLTREVQDRARATYMLLEGVRTPTNEDMEALRGARVFDIEPVSLGRLVEDHPEHFKRGQMDILDGRRRSELKNYVPPAMAVVMRFDVLDHPRGQGEQGFLKVLNAVDDYSESEIKPRNADAQAVLLPASALAQIDISLAAEGKALFSSHCTSVLDNYGAMRIGRGGPAGRLVVGDWVDGLAGVHVRITPGIVFPKNRSSQ
ncbi:MAG TPA: hypothetical protein VM077_04615 [Candidatus Limnocylindrales bacterium]|nr:hypothetical protein [Candidatus Limnocylindrales bacterium]